MKKITFFFCLLYSLPVFAETDRGPSFTSPKYKAQSAQEPMEGEMLVTYTYPADPCGTLMTEFSERGSVRVGRGPVYANALKICREYDPHMVPNDFSFRTFACSNNTNLHGQATFAFVCGYMDQDTVCTPERNAQSKQVDWNCGGIIKTRQQLVHPLKI